MLIIGICWICYCDGVTKEQIFLTERQLAERWQMGRSTLSGQRRHHIGCAFVTLGGSIRYRLTDVEEYERQQRRGPGSGEDQDHEL